MEAINRKERFYFILSVIVSVLVYVIAIFSLVGIAIIIGFACVFTLINVISLGMIRGNSLKVSEDQFPDVHKQVTDLAEKLKLKYVPEVYVVYSEGALNAFASRFAGKHIVVIYSEVFELAREKGEKELEFVLAHELVHVKRNHVLKQMILFPAKLVPLLGQAYSRACEYNCDNIAAEVIEDKEASVRALTILMIGKKLYKEVNIEAYVQQLTTDFGTFSWISEKLSTHPFLPKRIRSISGIDVQVNRGRIIGGVIALSISSGVIYLLVLLVMTGGAMMYGKSFTDSLGPVSEENSLFTNDTFGNDILEEPEGEHPPLILATIDGDIDEIERLVAEGADIEVMDIEDSTPLIYAIYLDNLEVAEKLLELGANPNHEDLYGTPLTIALEFGWLDMAILLYENGADVNQETYQGVSPLMMLGTEEEEDFYDAITEYYQY
ncbi:M48 family metallopeptidase [Salipaludibacillus sp. HK11]|uniref:M48 family metallopeptidase n=1 Tax=Salipaludibacillus sp. HK11 TaxID=3394320 RepID=UPI0039FCC696